MVKRKPQKYPVKHRCIHGLSVDVVHSKGDDICLVCVSAPGKQSKDGVMKNETGTE